jgi:cytochrome c biogenesis protein CcmG/thiol:disulfide interchange protein DsbE
MRRLLFILPAVALVLLGAVFIVLLTNPRDALQAWKAGSSWGAVSDVLLSPRRDPGEILSPFIGKPVPAFRLPVLDGEGEVSDADLRGGVSVFNVFASWCLPCKIEHPILMRMAREGRVRVIGLNYKDKPADAKKWLAELGNPFARIAADEKGRVAIDFGVYGVPETFIVDAGGIIRYKHVGPIHPGEYADKIVPVVERLLREGNPR